MDIRGSNANDGCSLESGKSIKSVLDVVFPLEAKSSRAHMDDVVVSDPYHPRALGPLPDKWKGPRHHAAQTTQEISWFLRR